MQEKEYTVEQFRLAILEDIKILGAELEEELKMRRHLTISR